MCVCVCVCVCVYLFVFVCMKTCLTNSDYNGNDTSSRPRVYKW